MDLSHIHLAVNYQKDYAIIIIINISGTWVGYPLTINATFVRFREAGGVVQFKVSSV
jgi:hypothetical protein